MIARGETRRRRKKEGGEEGAKGEETEVVDTGQGKERSKGNKQPRGVDWAADADVLFVFFQFGKVEPFGVAR